MGRPVIYLASPYSHPEAAVRSLRFGLACQAAARLIARGHVIYSPIAHSHCVAELGRLPYDWETWGPQCLAMLDVCSHLLVLTLDGWQDSKGVKAEAAHCALTGKPVLWSDFDGLEGFDFNRLPPP